MIDTMEGMNKINTRVYEGEEREDGLKKGGRRGEK